MYPEQRYLTQRSGHALHWELAPPQVRLEHAPTFAIYTGIR